MKSKKIIKIIALILIPIILWQDFVAAASMEHCFLFQKENTSTLAAKIHIETKSFQKAFQDIYGFSNPTPVFPYEHKNNESTKKIIPFAEYRKDAFLWAIIPMIWLGELFVGVVTLMLTLQGIVLGEEGIIPALVSIFSFRLFWVTILQSLTYWIAKYLGKNYQDEKGLREGFNARAVAVDYRAWLGRLVLHQNKPSFKNYLLGFISFIPYTLWPIKQRKNLDLPEKIETASKNSDYSPNNTGSLENEIKNFIQEIENVYHQKLKKEFSAYPSVCNISPYILAVSLSKYFNLGLGRRSNLPHRIEVVPGIHIQEDGEIVFHQWLIVYIKGKEALFIDDSYGQFDKKYFGKIVVAPYREALAQLRLSEFDAKLVKWITQTAIERYKLSKDEQETLEAIIMKVKKSSGYFPFWTTEEFLAQPLARFNKGEIIALIFGLDYKEVRHGNKFVTMKINIEKHMERMGLDSLFEDTLGILEKKKETIADIVINNNHPAWKTVKFFYPDELTAIEDLIGSTLYAESFSSSQLFVKLQEIIQAKEILGERFKTLFGEILFIYDKSLLEAERRLKLELKERLNRNPLVVREIMNYVHNTNFEFTDSIIDWLLDLRVRQIEDSSKIYWKARPEDLRELIYMGTPYALIKEAVKGLNLQPNDVFYDLGFGYGRWLIYLSLVEPRVGKIKGVEMVPERVEEVRRVKEFLGLDNVELILGNVRNVDFSDGTVFFMFDPFTKETLKVVVRKLKEAAKYKKIRIVSWGECTKFFNQEKDWLKPEEGEVIHTDYVPNIVIFESIISVSPIRAYLTDAFREMRNVYEKEYGPYYASKGQIDRHVNKILKLLESFGIENMEDLLRVIIQDRKIPGIGEFRNRLLIEALELWKKEIVPINFAVKKIMDSNPIEQAI